VGFRLKQAFIFDFDGTLVDSEQAIYKCFQNITKQLAPERFQYAKRILIGPPLRDTASEILGPENQGLLEEFVQLFIQLHDDQLIKHTKPYPDVLNILELLQEKQIPMAIATNKRIAPTKKLISHFKWNKYFKYIECSDSENLVRKKDTMIKNIISHNDNFQGSYFVGDTVNDGVSANKNKCKFIQALYGYGTNQDWSEVNIHKKIESIKDLKELIDS